MGHWKRPFKSNFLASSDIDDKDLVLVIKEVKQEMCTLSTGKELCNVAHFTDTSFKPMILNVGNSKIVKRFAGQSTDTDTWKNIPVTIYVNPSVRLGSETVEGLRIRPVQPKLDKKGQVKKQELTPESANWGAIVKWIQDGNPIEKVWEKYDVSGENKTKLTEAIEEVKG
jgi:hypothetical protein